MERQREKGRRGGVEKEEKENFAGKRKDGIKDRKKEIGKARNGET